MKEKNIMTAIRPTDSKWVVTSFDYASLYSNTINTINISSIRGMVRNRKILKIFNIEK